MLKGFTTQQTVKSASKDKKADTTAEERAEDKQSSVKADEEEGYWQKIKRFVINLQTVSLRDKIFFVQNMKIMIKGGLSLGQALKTISQQVSNSYFKDILMDISDQVQAGTAFSKALGSYPKTFDHLFINMIKSGELSGGLDNVLDKLYVQMKRDHDLVGKVKGAMIYPAVVLVAMFGIGAAMMVFVIPKLITVFDEFNADLPVPTKILIAVSRFISHNGMAVLIGLVIFLVVFLKFYHSESGRRVFHKLFLTLPIISGIVKKINLARFCRTASSLLKTDIPIVKSLEITSLVVGNYYYQQALKEASKKIAKGMQINKVLSDYPKLFPATVLQTLKVGEESGAVDSTLEEVAAFYEEDVNQVMANLPSIIEPILILVLGLGVGAMAVAVIMPMYSLTSSI